jgi:uncharacterized repeat protein (TIGR03803 family)
VAIGAAVLTIGFLTCDDAAAQTVDVVASFDPVATASLYGALVQGPDGTFFGTASQGGPSNAGTVFQVTADGVVTVLYAFSGGSDGAYPYAGLVLTADGTFYGTTLQGGDANAGTVFQITSSGTLSRIYSFSGGGDGGYPSGALIQASDGSLYGTTSQGGASNAGTVFNVTADGTLSTVYAFTGATDGGYPAAGVALGTDGNMYGATLQGGDGGAGTLFQLAPGGTLTVMHAFTGAVDGGYPYAGVIQATDGAFYGTTFQGGAAGLGIVFRASADGTFAILHDFTGGSDGAYPYAALIQTSDNNFFGTAMAGGAAGAGALFELTPAGAFTNLYAFTGGTDGAYPVASLTAARDGTLYGSTTSGGALGGGTAFRWTPLALPVISWSGPSPIVYGTRLSATQLNATADVPGTFTYGPPAGTVLHAGDQTLSVNFVPNDSTTYATVTTTVTLTVTPRAAAVRWVAPTAIPYGTPLGTAQLDASANAPGVFVYVPPASTVLDIGTSTLTVTFVPYTTDYTTATGAVELIVTPATPVVTWTPPAAIVSGTPLSSLQLNATANVDGSFDYSPAAGTVLDQGSQTLSVTFTPTDTLRYTTATATVPLIVASRSDFTASGGGNVYPLQFTPASGARGLIVAGYALAADPVAGLRVTGSCSYYTVRSGSGRGGGYHTTTTYFNQTCTWDLYGKLLSVATGAPAAPTPIAVNGSATIYAIDASSGVYTGTDSTLPGRGFVYTPGAHYTWVTANPYTVLQQQSPYVLVITIKSDGDLPLTVFAMQTTALRATATVNGTTCSGAIPVGSTCTITVTYDPSALSSPTGLAYDTLDVRLLTDAGQTHDFLQGYTVVVRVSDGDGN